MVHNQAKENRETRFPKGDLHVSDPERGIDFLQMILEFICAVEYISLIDQFDLMIDDPLTHALACIQFFAAVQIAGGFPHNMIIRESRMAADPPDLIVIFHTTAVIFPYGSYLSKFFRS